MSDIGHSTPMEKGMGEHMTVLKFEVPVGFHMGVIR